VAGCEQAGTDRSPPDVPEDHFGDATSVRITAPDLGATVEDRFDVQFESGADVDTVRVEIDGVPTTDYVLADGIGAETVEVASGHHDIDVVGYDEARVELSRDTISVRVLSDPSEGWVSITSPIDGSNPVNPVQFAVDGSDDIARVELMADEWPIGEVAPGGVLTYAFSGTGYERTIEALGFDAAEVLVATDVITITVEAGEEAPVSDFNALVLDLLATYPTDGSIGYYWPTGSTWSGSTQDIYYQGDLVADDGGFEDCYCTGLTWELYLRAWQALDQTTGGTGDDLNGLAYDEVMDMRVDWYVRDIDGDGPGIALENYGLGESVASFDDWQAGDFVQLWRTSGSGHQVVFMDWITDGSGNRLGFDYFGCNSGGPSYNDEYFGTFSGALDPLHMYSGRPSMPEDWY
jgi:hypothetical protein